VKPSFDAPSDREVFVLPLSISAEDIDANGHVNNVVYVRWLQDAGTAHWRSRFSGVDIGFTWVVLRHEIDYRRALKLGDGARAVTWVGEPHGAKFDRYVVIEGPGGVCAQGHTQWAMVDVHTMRPVRIPAQIAVPFLRVESDGETALPPSAHP
jgi:acyl-CoA thioester hydrolase